MNLRVKKNFYYRGCGWKCKQAFWSEIDMKWIFLLVQLFDNVYGGNSLEYIFIQNRGTAIAENCDPRKSFEYDHAKWEAQYQEAMKEVNIAVLPRRRRLNVDFHQASHGNTQKSTGQESGVTPLSKPASPGSTPKSTGQVAGVTPLSKPASPGSTPKSTGQVAGVTPSK